ncbi:hypothetical protein T484DRAFT_1777991 [Baffinella frigidus]|nr:hypothetical protein T484DRAFT_1777991 [Cryptophyta sp. CCMP2293]
MTQALPNTIGHLARLETLSVTSNLLSAFPDKMRHMDSLRILSLQMRHVDSLRILSLQGNRLTALPPSIVRAPALVEVYVSDNLIEAFPANLQTATTLRGSCTFLRSLPLEGNNLWSPPPDIMGESLPLEGKQLWSPPPGIMVQPRAVQFAYLRQLDASQETHSMLVAGKTVTGEP